MNKDLILREKLALQRTILANQSIFLAFVRTSMYFLVAGISINNLTTFRYKFAVECVFIGVSIVLFAVGIVNFQRQKTKISTGERHIRDYKEEYLTPTK